MADKDKDKGKSKKGGGARTTAFTALLAVVAVIAAWLSNCIPGFGIGSSGDAEGEAEKAEAEKAVEAEAEPEPEPEPAKPEAKEDEQAGEAAGKTLTVTIDVRGCALAEAEPSECASMCEREELFEGIDDAILDVKQASHESVVAMTDCLKTKGIDKIAIRRE